MDGYETMREDVPDSRSPNPGTRTKAMKGDIEIPTEGLELEPVNTDRYCRCSVWLYR